MSVRSPNTVAVPSRRGMTLVELLVVMGILASLLGLAVTGLRGRKSQKGGAEMVAAVLSAAQGRALGVAEGGAAILTPDPTQAGACTTLFDAVMQPLIEATVTGVPPTPPSATTAAASVTPTNGDDVQRAYKILLNGTQDTPGVAPPTAWLDFNGSTSAVSFRTSLGQTINNTVWPKAPGGGAFNALLAQYPAKSSTQVDLDEAVVIDLRYSGIGHDISTAYGSLNGKGSIAVVFDRVGRVAEVIQQVPDPGASASPGTAQPAIPVGLIFFLVALRDDVANPANAVASLASLDSLWVVLEPQTGRVFVADNVPVSASDSTSLQAARAKAIQGIGAGQ
ncbi:MAG: Tfp pilus assembly protein FimT/FimU [Planctomycetaceae bacterium]